MLFSTFGNWMLYLYIEVAKITHSCDPNCYWDIDNDGIITITTVGDISKDKELTISYNGSGIFNGRCHTYNKSIYTNICFQCKLVRYCYIRIIIRNNIIVLL